MEGEKDTEVGSSCWCDARELHRVRAEEVSSLLERAKTWKDEKCDQLKDAIDRCSEANTVPEDVLKVLHELKLDFDASCNTLKRLWDCLVAEDTKDIDLVEMKRQEVLRVETANRLNSILCSMKTRAWNDARSTCKKGLERAMVAHPSEESKSQKVKLLFRLGKASAKLGEFEEAREALLEALKLDPSISTSVCSELKLLERLQEKHQVAQRASYARIFDSSAEIYDKEERAPKGQAFPAYRDRDMSRGLERVNYEEEFREIDEEERMLQRSQEARSRVRAVDMTYKGNPWDPSGEKQQREIDNYYLKMFAEQDQGN
uniref:Uncharacterized protein n=1 Tax=Picocystis salinarum TaxID=88271 RepID=A0A6U9QFL2_9CHLO